MRGKSEWRGFLRGERKASPEERARVLQYVKKRARVCIDDLTLISEGLGKLTDGTPEERAERHRVQTFPAPSLGKLFVRLLLEIQRRPEYLRAVLEKYGKDVCAGVSGVRVDPLKLRRPKR